MLDIYDGKQSVYIMHADLLHQECVGVALSEID